MDNPDRTAPKEKTSHRPYRLRTQYVFLVEEDGVAFSRALENEFGSVVYMRMQLGEEGESPFGESFGDFDTGLSYALLPGPDWVPKLVPSKGYRRANLSVWPRRTFMHMANYRKRQRRDECPFGEVVNLSRGYVSIQYTPGDAEEHDFAKKVIRVLNSVTTNRIERFSPSTGEVFEPGKRVTLYRAGHHAIAWCRESPRHLMDYMCFELDGQLVDRAYRPRT